MTNTKNVKLKKPDGSDKYNVADFNDNADVLDNLCGVQIIKERISKTLTLSNASIALPNPESGRHTIFFVLRRNSLNTNYFVSFPANYCGVNANSELMTPVGVLHFIWNGTTLSVSLLNSSYRDVTLENIYAC